MREIKFKVWCLTNKKFLCEGNGFHLNVLALKFREIFLFPENYRLLQFTGLIDRDRKEIYEGDIIEWENAGYQKLRISEVAYYEDNFGIPRDEENNLTKVKVIGNIFETPPDILK